MPQPEPLLPDARQSPYISGPEATSTANRTICTEAIVPNFQTFSIAANRLRRLFAVLLCGLLPCLCLAGCAGKTLVDDNPVFSETPPRRTLTNRSSVANSDDLPSSVVRTVSYDSASPEPLTGNSVVAEVNGSPIFVDDLIGSIRLTVESNPKLKPDQVQQILHQEIKPRLTNYIEQEIAIQALRKAIPEDRQQLVRDSLEEPFQTEVIAKIKADKNLETDQQLNELLATQGLSIDLLRESFFRVQMAQGYLSSVVDVSDIVDRTEMLEYYKTHREDFTSKERLRCQEIVVQFARHGGREGAKQRMAKVVEALNDGKEFPEVAEEFSDALSAEQRGDMGWLEPGSLADKEAEKKIFAAKPGETTEVFEQDDRFEIFRVVTHEFATTAPFQQVQEQIKEKIKQQRLVDARQNAMTELREKATIITMYDNAESGTATAHDSFSLPNR